MDAWLPDGRTFWAMRNRFALTADGADRRVGEGGHFGFGTACWARELSARADLGRSRSAAITCVITPRTFDRSNPGAITSLFGFEDVGQSFYVRFTNSGSPATAGSSVSFTANDVSVTSVGAGVSGVPMVIVCTADGAGTYLYSNGALLNSGSAPTDAANTTSSNLGGGGPYYLQPLQSTQSSSRPADHVGHLFLWHNRTLDPDEAAALYEDPFCIFEPLAPRRYAMLSGPIGGGGGGAAVAGGIGAGAAGRRNIGQPFAPIGR